MCASPVPPGPTRMATPWGSGPDASRSLLRPLPGGEKANADPGWEGPSAGAAVAARREAARKLHSRDAF